MCCAAALGVTRMTTLIYDHKNKLIATDSRYTISNYIVTDKGKKYMVDDNGDLWFVTGALTDRKPFINAYLHNEKGLDLDCFGLLVRDSAAHAVYNTEAGFKTLELEFSEAWGSGADYAIAALDHGKSAKQAVKYAMTRDCHTGGKVRVYNVKKREFYR